LEDPTPQVLCASASDDWLERVRDALQGAPWHVRALRNAKDVLEALAVAGARGTRLVLLDAALDDTTGLALCRRIRETDAVRRTPVVFVSRFASEIDRVLCFENGADDFVADPFFGRELLSRVHAVLRRDMRRGRGTAEPREARFGDVAIDLRRGRIEVQGQPVDLTARELDVLRTLVRHEGRVVRREDLLEALAGPEERTLRVVDTHVKAIRRKLGPARDHVQTVRGVGYRFDADG
jgi:two-component system phosphate regulon response regulator PhoB